MVRKRSRPTSDGGKVASSGVGQSLLLLKPTKLKAEEPPLASKKAVVAGKKATRLTSASLPSDNADAAEISAKILPGRREIEDDGEEEGEDDAGDGADGEASEEGDDGDDDDGDDDDEDGENDDDDDDGDDSDSQVPDFRKRIRKRKKVDNPEHQASPDGSETAAMAPADDGAEKAPGTTEEYDFPSDGTYRNKQRVLLFSSRGITTRYRHFLEDLRKLVPHHKKDVKLDVGRDESLASAVNEIAEVKSCSSCVFLECRKRRDLYLWAGKTPCGPSVKFHVLNVHTMDELKLTGNCMLGSRPFLSFDAKFAQTAHWRLMKDVLMDVFNTPRGHPKSKPFVDRVMSFFVADGKIWVRNYQIVDKGDGTDSSLNKKIERQAQAGEEDTLSLVEIGPRFVLDPIRIFDGSFGGPTLFQNTAYVSPNNARAAIKRKAGTKYEDRQESKTTNKEKKRKAAVKPGPLDDVFKG